MNHNQNASANSPKQPAAIPGMSGTTPLSSQCFGNMHGYNLEKIEELNARLARLNLMENAREISAICHEIIRAKKELVKISLRTDYLA